MSTAEKARWFSEHVHPHEPALRAYLSKRFPALPDHDDLVQETYARILRVDDPGRSMTRSAVEAGVDLVMVAGGDGTVRVVCSELSGTGVPVGLLPSGTGNLLARNLNLTLDDVENALASS